MTFKCPNVSDARPWSKTLTSVLPRRTGRGSRSGVMNKTIFCSTSVATPSLPREYAWKREELS